MRNYIFYVFDFIKQEHHIAAQPISVEFKFFETLAVVVTDYTAFAFVITIRLASINSDCWQMFDLK